uniref:E3 ubiquitin-protein ligase TRIM39-like n=1 Tax=Pristiophorus japonicus TaxID=55135 RepID=UPI00398F40F1
MAAGSEMQGMMTETVCSICLDFYRSPVTAPCGHSFCRLCLLQHWERGEDTFSCPRCEKEFGQRSIYPNKRLSRRAERARRCVLAEGEPQCQAPAGQAGANAVPPTAAGPGAQPSSSVKELAAQYKEKLQNRLDSLQRRKNYLSKCRAAQKENRVGLKKYIETLRENIVSQFAQLQQILRSEEAAMISRLDAEETIMSQDIEDNMIKIAKDTASINQTISVIQSRLALQEAELLKDMKFIIKQCGYDYQTPREVSEALTLGEFNGPLQYMVWRRLFKEIRTAPAPLVLDAKTAHPRLSLSADCRRLRAGVEKQVRAGRAHVGRSLCALGSEGFASGRIYWEVEVRMNWDWAVGVAKASVADQEGFTPGPAAGVWAVRRSGEEYAALTSPRTPLPLSIRPRRIGVYLDYEGEQVSFYNADDMSHLFTFTDTFTEELYPYFYTGCKVDSLKLVTLRI